MMLKMTKVCTYSMRCFRNSMRISVKLWQTRFENVEIVFVPLMLMCVCGIFSVRCTRCTDDETPRSDWTVLLSYNSQHTAVRNTHFVYLLDSRLYFFPFSHANLNKICESPESSLFYHRFLSLFIKIASNKHQFDISQSNSIVQNSQAEMKHLVNAHELKLQFDSSYS